MSPNTSGKIFSTLEFTFLPHLPSSSVCSFIILDPVTTGDNMVCIVLNCLGDRDSIFCYKSITLQKA